MHTQLERNIEQGCAQKQSAHISNDNGCASEYDRNQRDRKPRSWETRNRQRVRAKSNTRRRAHSRAHRNLAMHEHQTASSPTAVATCSTSSGVSSAYIGRDRTSLASRSATGKSPAL